MTKATAVRFYHGGDYCEYTGRAEEQCGAKWFEFLVLSAGPRAGRLLVTANPPGIYSSLPCRDEVMA